LETIQELCDQVEIIIHGSCVEKMVMSLDYKIGLRNTLVHEWMPMSYCLIYYHCMILDGAPTKRRPSIDFILITKCLISLTFTSWDLFLWRVPYIVDTWILIYTLFVNVVLMLAHKSSWTYNDVMKASLSIQTNVHAFVGTFIECYIV
jgi:hypothetical protein